MDSILGIVLVHIQLIPYLKGRDAAKDLVLIRNWRNLKRADGAMLEKPSAQDLEVQILLFERSRGCMHRYQAAPLAHKALQSGQRCGRDGFLVEIEYQAPNLRQGQAKQ
jgi:hypothetical protein